MTNREIDVLVKEHYDVEPKSRFIEDIPKYSTNIEAALELIERIPLFCSLYYNPNNKVKYPLGFKKYTCVFSQAPNREYLAKANTAPMAICLAALKIKGVEVTHD